MQPIVILVILFLIFLSFSAIVPLSTQRAQLLQSQEAQPQAQAEAPETAPQTKPTVKPTIKPKTTTPAISAPETKPTFSINTYIVSGPKEGEIIEETNKVTFEFEAKVFPEDTKGTIIFETKIEGLDDKWLSSSAKKRTITFPPGPKEYTFLVRAKLKNVIDSTPAQRTFKINISPYFGKIKISNVRIQTSSRSSLITLTTRLQKEEEINITGWQIRGIGGSFVIPTGIETYHPGYNPVPTESIFVKQGDIIYLSGAQSPLGRNRNFRPNKCLGYLTNYRDFPIPLPKTCPKPTKEEISHLHPCCQQFILRMQKCGIPHYSSTSTIALDAECIAYLNENFNYAGCFIDYSQDEDFLEKKWHIYLNHDIVVTNNCDTLYLRDQNGLFVAEYSYGRPICKW